MCGIYAWAGNFKYARIKKYENDPGFEGVNHGSNFPKF